MHGEPSSGWRIFHERLKFTLLAAAALILPITVSTIAAAYCVAIFDIGGTVSTSVKATCFFAVLAAEAVAYDKFQRFRNGRNDEE